MSSTRLIHTTPIRVRYAETDKMGIVWNAHYLTYFAVGRTELLRACGVAYARIEQAGFMLPLLESFVRYKAPATYDDLLALETSYEPDSRSARLRIDYCVRRDTTEIAEGHTLHTFVHAGSLRPARPPAIFVDAVAAALRNPERNHTVF